MGYMGEVSPAAGCCDFPLNRVLLHRDAVACSAARSVWVTFICQHSGRVPGPVMGGVQQRLLSE